MLDQLPESAGGGSAEVSERDDISRDRGCDGIVGVECGVLASHGFEAIAGVVAERAGAVRELRDELFC